MHPRIKTLIIKPKNQIKNAIGLYFKIIEFCFFSCLWLPQSLHRVPATVMQGLNFPSLFQGNNFVLGDEFFLF